jgi:hypothetical protein
MNIQKVWSFSKMSFILNIFCLILIFAVSNIFSQTYQPNYYGTTQPNQNYMANSTAFKQEIARMEINVVRAGKQSMPITQVPRLQKSDVLKVRMLEEEVGGMKPDQSNWNWTFLVAFINPGRNNEKEEAVSEEINFRKTGWYREYSFNVPYDSQPIFFLYPKPNYRSKIIKLISKKYEEIKKVGEKTIDIAGAYAQIGTFLNELQGVLYQNNYGGYGSYQSVYNNYGSYGSGNGYNYNRFAEQTVERLARSFNIQLPSCWQGGGYGSSYNTYNNYGNNGYGNNGYYGAGGQDVVGRIQCVAKNIRLEDFDLSVTRLLQQGGILLVSQLQQKYPQIAHWIGIAALAIDFIVKITGKTPLRIVPTVLSSSENQRQTYNYQNPYTNNFAGNQTVSTVQNDAVKISVYAENQPNSGEFVTAYPIVTHKWQAEPDAETISLSTPSLLESCLHTGQNLLRNTDLTTDWVSDSFANNFKLVVSSSNGFRKEFPLRKNLGMNGWELNITKEDLGAFPKIKINLEAEVTATRGFNEIRSPKFELPLDIGGTWEMDPKAQSEFAVGGKRVVILKNQFGSCRCLQAIIYKPSFGGQFVFEQNAKENPLLFSEDGKEVSFEIDTANFQSGAGQLELRQYGGDTTTVNTNLYPASPNITDLRMAKGDRQAVITGERLEQVKFVMINGKKALVEGGNIIKNTPYNLPGSLTSVSERTVIFEDPNAREKSNLISLELGLDNNRIVPVKEKFNVTLARPTIIANESNEINGILLEPKVLANKPNIFQMLPIFPIETTGVIANLENSLTNYDFKTGNISIETKIEGTELSSNQLPKATFEVLDWKNLKITFLLSPEIQSYLGGKKLQFRIRDKERGNSDWFTVGKTFVRTPIIKSFNCAITKKGFCQLKGVGIEYISDISVDGGKVWYPQSPATWSVMPTSDGFQEAMVPKVPNIRNQIRFKLRDLPKTEGLTFKNLGF